MDKEALVNMQRESPHDVSYAFAKELAIFASLLQLHCLDKPSHDLKLHVTF